MTININAVIAGALGFVVALSWNDAVNKSIKSFFPVRHENDIAKVTLIYAIIMTIFVIFIIYIINQTKKTYYKYSGKPLFDTIEGNKLVNSKDMPMQIIRLWEPPINEKTSKN